MSDTGAAAVERARALVGARFRPQGRAPASGLDCVGLVLRAFAIAEAKVPRDYRMTGNEPAKIERQLRRFFEVVDRKERCAGDVLLCRLRVGHCHLAIDCGGSFIHADARLRRVVEVPGSPPWPLIAAYRVANSNFRSD